MRTQIVTITTSLTEREVAKLDRKAAERNMSRAELLRVILRTGKTVLDFPRDIDHPRGRP